MQNKPETTYKLIPVESIPELPKLTCLRCANTWTPRTEKPKQCPKCKSLSWNKPRKKDMKK